MNNQHAGTRSGFALASGQAIRFESIAKSYRGRDVLRAVSFEVPAGASTAIAGINGAGKSTLLRCLLDFCRPDQGRILIDGVEHTSIAARSRLGWLPERFVPPAHLRAIECLHWLAGMRSTRIDEQQARERAAAFGLDERALHARVRELSKGMTQKLGLLSIALSPCPIWILDEPMSGLDPQARLSVAQMIDDARRQGRTVLFTTHDMRDLARRCDRVVVLHEGTVRFDASPREFLQRFAGVSAESVAGNADPDDAFLQCIGARRTTRTQATEEAACPA
jgi:ABC-2 type transport system ATP-binding protein